MWVPKWVRLRRRALEDNPEREREREREFSLFPQTKGKRIL